METQQAPGITRIAAKYGLIDAVIAFAIFAVLAMTRATQNWMSLISIAVLAALMALAHREFKKNHEGVMSYGQGVGLGTLLSVIASVLASMLLYVYVAFIDKGYPAAALKAQQAVFEQRGMSGAQLDQAIASTSGMLTLTGIFIGSLISGIIVGFVVALIVSIFTKDADPRAVI